MDVALTLLATAGTVAAVLYGLRLFRVGLAWLGVALGGVWGWTLGGMLFGGSTAAAVGALVGAAVLGAMSGAAEKLIAGLLGAFGFWVLALGLASAGGLHGSYLAWAGLAGALIGVGLVMYLHDFVVSIGIAVWGTGFLRLTEFASGGAPKALPNDAWINAPELIVAGSYGRALADGPLRALVLVGFVGVAYLLQRMDSLEARGKTGKLGPERLRRLGLTCVALSLLPLLAPLVAEVGGAKYAAWLHLPWHSLGLGLLTWPAATLLVWLVVGWARKAPLAARIAASLLAGLTLLAFSVGVQHLVDGVPLEPLLKDALNPSGPFDPDVIGAAIFALLVFVGPLAGRRSRGI
jgi:hypothetical protein